MSGLKLKVLPQFPAKVIGGNGIKLTSLNGIYTFDLDYSEFGQASSLPPGGYALVFNPVNGSYSLVPTSLMGGGGGGGSTVYVQDSAPVGAPVNSLWWESDTGTLYVNYNDGNSTQFVAVTPGSAASSGIPEAPNDGTIYGRKNLAWSAVVAGTSGRETLTANRIYYVRTDGSNSNNGLSNTAGGAFLTVQQAINTVVKLDLAGFAVTIQVGPGVYTGSFSATVPFIGGPVTLSGDLATPSNCLLSVAGTVCTVQGQGCNLRIQGFKLQSSMVGGSLLAAFSGGFIIITGKMEFGAVPTGLHMYANGGNISNFGVPYTISGGAAFHMETENLGYIGNNSAAVTLTGTPAFSVAFAQARNTSVIECVNNTWSGGATGQRFNALTAGGISANGGSGSFPGSAAGVITSPGWVT